MLAEQTGEPPLDQLAPVAARADLVAVSRAARDVFVEESVTRYVVALLRHTRANRHLALGASPRRELRSFGWRRPAPSSSGASTSPPHDISARWRSRCSRIASCWPHRRARPGSALPRWCAPRSTARPSRETEELRGRRARARSPRRRLGVRVDAPRGCGARLRRPALASLGESRNGPVVVERTLLLGERIEGERPRRGGARPVPRASQGAHLLSQHTWLSRVHGVSVLVAHP